MGAANRLDKKRVYHSNMLIESLLKALDDIGNNPIVSTKTYLVTSNELLIV